MQELSDCHGGFKLELFVLIIVVAIIWSVLKGKKKDQHSVSRKQVFSQEQSSADVPEIKVTFSTSYGGGGRRGNARDADVGELTDDGSGGWVLNPHAPLTLTVLGANKQVAQQLRNIIESADYWSQKTPEVALVIAQHNIRFKEVDEFLDTHRKQLEAEVTRQISESSEWAGASARDQADMKAEFADKALEKLGVWVGRSNLALLLTSSPSALEEDDALSLKFQGDAGLYSFYLNQLGRKNSVVTAKTDDYWRKSWEKLTDIGLAKRGKDIPLEHILESLRLKDLNEMLKDTIEKPFGRKAKAIEAASALPDIEQRVSSQVSFRETFQVIAPHGIDVTAIAESFAYASEVASLVLQTYFTGAETLDAINERKRERGVYDAWEVINWEDPLPSCAASYCKKYERLPAKKPPYHVGCSCRLENSFKDI